MRGRIKFPFSSELLSNLYNGLYTSSYSWQSARRSLKRYQDRHIHMFSGAWCWVRLGQTPLWWQSLLGTIDCWFCCSIQHRNKGSILRPWAPIASEVILRSVGLEKRHWRLQKHLMTSVTKDGWSVYSGGAREDFKGAGTAEPPPGEETALKTITRNNGK